MWEKGRDWSAGPSSTWAPKLRANDKGRPFDRSPCQLQIGLSRQRPSRRSATLDEPYLCALLPAKGNRPCAFALASRPVSGLACRGAALMLVVRFKWQNWSH